MTAIKLNSNKPFLFLEDQTAKYLSKVIEGHWSTWSSTKVSPFIKVKAIKFLLWLKTFEVTISWHKAMKPLWHNTHMLCGAGQTLNRPYACTGSACGNPWHMSHRKRIKSNIPLAEKVKDNIINGTFHILHRFCFYPGLKFKSLFFILHSSHLNLEELYYYITI